MPPALAGMTIEWDGRIMPCNNDDYLYLFPGNVTDMSVADCSQSPLVRSARVLYMQDRSHELASCNGCPWRTTQVLKKRESEKKDDASWLETFALYCKMPKEYWPKIERAEKDAGEGLRMFKELREIYIGKYFN